MEGFEPSTSQFVAECAIQLRHINVLIKFSARNRHRPSTFLFRKAAIGNRILIIWRAQIVHLTKNCGKQHTRNVPKLMSRSLSRRRRTLFALLSNFVPVRRFELLCPKTAASKTAAATNFTTRACKINSEFL